MLLSSLNALVDERRLRLYGWTLVGLYLAIAAGWVLAATDGIDIKGKPLGYDFITFYAAARLALQGQAAEVFSVPAIMAAERAAVPGNEMLFLWHYPPIFQLIVTPLGWLPYGAAFALFVGSTLALYLAFMRRLIDHRLGLLLAAAFPPVFVNVFHGQSACLHAVLMGYGLLMLERRPALAGMALGLLAYKPHLGALLPFLLLAGGYWRSFVAAAFTATLFAAAATAAFGLAYWQAFAANLPLVSEVLEKGMLPWAKMPTIFATASLLGAPTALAYGLQAASAAAIALATVWAWWRPGPLDLKAALAVVAACCMSPYLFDYDLVLLAIPVAILGLRAWRSGDRSDVALLVCVSVMPLFAPGLAEATHLQVMAAGLLVLYAVAWHLLATLRARALDTAPLVLADA